MNDESPTELIARFRRGDQRAATTIYARFAERLLSLARSRLSRRLSQRIDPEDVLQSVYRSFFVRVREGRLTVESDEDLWPLLAAITVRKVRRQAVRQQAAVRDASREFVPASARGDAADAEIVENLASHEPTPAEVIAAADELAWLMARMDRNERNALELRLQQYSIEEIGVALNTHERTVRRWLTKARNLLEQREQEFELRARQAEIGQPARDAFGDELQSKNLLRIENYQLLRFIGSGGASKVFAAEQKTSGKQVAIKVLRKHLRVERRIVEQFVSEASLTARLSHPHIVPLFGIGRMPGGGYFLVAEFVDGCNLAEWAKEQPCTPAEAVAITRSVAEAVHHAHCHGILHCDIKPQNVLRDRGGKIWLTDFGLGRLLIAQNAECKESLAGTWDFMAPEQRAGGEIGPWTDVYGLGALLHALLFGTPPGETIPESPEVPKSVRAICAKCLAVDPVTRYSSAQAVAEALSSIPLVT